MLVTRGDAVPAGLEVFRRRLEGVLVARSYVMMDYDIPDENVDAAVALTPGIESPTVCPVASRGLGRRPRDGARGSAPSG